MRTLALLLVIFCIVYLVVLIPAAIRDSAVIKKNQVEQLTKQIVQLHKLHEDLPTSCDQFEVAVRGIIEAKARD